MSKRKSKFTLILLLLVAVVITLIIYKINASLENYHFGKPSEQMLVNIDSVTDKSSFNALLVGVDKSGLLADAIMLVNVNKDTETIRLISVPRDTKVTVNGKKRKINSCYAKGGVDLLIEEVKELTQAPVNYYAVIEPGTLSKIVDCLGGVEYEVEQDMKYSDPTQDLYIDLKAGKQILDGDKAEQYCRYRSYAMGDLQRTQSQQKFFKALFEQKLKLKYVTKLKAVFDVAMENLESNVTIQDVTSNIAVMKMISDGSQIEIFDVPGEFNDMRKEGVSYYLIRNEHLAELREICKTYFNGYSD